MGVCPFPRPTHEPLGVTLSREQASWAQRAIGEEGLTELAEVRHGDYRDIREAGTAVSRRSDKGAPR